MAKSTSKNDYNKSFQKKQAQRLSKLKRNSGNKVRKSPGSKKRTSITAKQAIQIESLQNKLSVYENIISELREKIREYEISESENQNTRLEQDNYNPQDQFSNITTENAAPDFSIENEELKAQLNSMKESVSDWQSKAVRLSADLQNVQKQNELDISQAKKSSKKNTIISIMEFLNTLNISFNYIPASDDEKVVSFIQTLKGSYDKVIGELKAHGIDILTVDPGDQFDPNFMNILNTQITDQQEEVANEVVQVVGLGLKIDGQLIQPASVIIK